MKNVITILLAFCFALTSYAQSIDTDDLVGTWQCGNSTITLQSDHDMYAKWNDGTSSTGTWGFRSDRSSFSDIYMMNKALVLNYEYTNRRFTVNSVSSSQMSLTEENSGKTYRFKKSSSSSSRKSSVSAGEGLLFLGALILGAAILGGDSDAGSSSTYQGEYSNDPNENRQIQIEKERRTREIHN